MQARTRPRVRSAGEVRAAVRLSLVLAAVLATEARSQVDAIRRARDAARDATTNVASLFGKEPAITTTIDDARDGVAALDGFEPTSYSPMAEMPRAPGGTYLLVPGTYVLVSQSFCLKPGAYGPRTNSGYLHAAWKGEKAPLVSTLIARSVDHPEVPQRQVQLLLWAIVMRADMNQLYPETKQAALKLLTSAELLDLAGYKLGVVPDAVRDRALQSVPEPARSALETENEMRRLLVSAETQYADVERVAVREGALPASEAMMSFPEGRWSYHPSGFFIRYAPRTYTFMRVDIYYPDKFEIHRDGSGRITSVTKADGRAIRPDRSPWQLLGDDGADRARLRTLQSLSHGVMTDARRELLALAHADYDDLRRLEPVVDRDDRAQVARGSDIRRSLDTWGSRGSRRFLAVRCSNDGLAQCKRGMAIGTRSRPSRAARRAAHRPCRALGVGTRAGVERLQVDRSSVSRRPEARCPFRRTLRRRRDRTTNRRQSRTPSTRRRR